MGMKDRIPKGFYKLFGSKYTEYYQRVFLLSMRNLEARTLF